MRLEYQIIAAVLLDAMVGDPRRFPHPVRYMGAAARSLEKPLRRTFSSTRVAGSVMVVCIVGGTGAVTASLLYGAGLIHPYAEYGLGILLIYTALAPHDLAVHGMRVFRALRAGNIDRAREAVGMIVGRDTENLDEPEIVRATVETVAENLVDGVTAPLLFAVVGGPVGAMMYKAVNTLDSTFGYRTEEYRRFGWASARFDDVVNWIPARLTGPCVILAAFLTGRPVGPAVGILRRDRKNHDSPNAGIPEAAFAGSLQVQLGGVNSYFGVPHTKPTIGDRIDDLRSTHIPAANRLMYVSSVVFLLAALGLRFLLTFGGVG